MAGRWKVPLLLALLFVVEADECRAQEISVTEPPASLKEQLDLSPFYKKCLVTDGFPIVSSEKVCNFALLEAAYIIDKMLADRDDIRQALVKNKVRLAILATKEFTCDLPEFRDLRPTAFWNVRARGLGPVPHRPVIVCGEENLLAVRGDPYPLECVLVHELGHAIHTMAMPDVDPEFGVKLRAAFDAANEEGLWQDTYAATDRHEYWAEGVRRWFDTNSSNELWRDIVKIRARLKHYDPRLALLLEEVFPDNSWKYLKPDDRNKIGHLKGCNPGFIPKFEWPREMFEEYQRHLAKQRKGRHVPQIMDYFPRLLSN